mgnify:CR=1 FL=1
MEVLTTLGYAFLAHQPSEPCIMHPVSIAPLLIHNDILTCA